MPVQPLLHSSGRMAAKIIYRNLILKHKLQSLETDLHNYTPIFKPGTRNLSPKKLPINSTISN
jgi:hypothetical protein